MSPTSPLWPYAVVPAPLHGRGADHIRTLVPDGARVAGAVADALVDVDADEHARRAACGLQAAEALGLLDALLCLPFGEDIPMADIGPAHRASLAAAPLGCVEWSADFTLVRRVLRPAVDVPVVIVRAGRWREGLRRASAFEPFARRVVLLERLPGRWDTLAWEADALGIGVWTRDDGGSVVEVIAPAPWKQRYVKAAGWRFRERAYSVWIRSTPR